MAPIGQLRAQRRGKGAAGAGRSTRTASRPALAAASEGTAAHHRSDRQRLVSHSAVLPGPSRPRSLLAEITRWGARVCPIRRTGAQGDRTCPRSRSAVHVSTARVKARSSSMAAQRCSTRLREQDRRHLTPKGGCHQGGLRRLLRASLTVSCRLSCLTLAETVQRGNNPSTTLDGTVGKCPNLHPLAARLRSTPSPRNAAICTPGMIMAAKVLLDHTPNPEPQ